MWGVTVPPESQSMKATLEAGRLAVTQVTAD